MSLSKCECRISVAFMSANSRQSSSEHHRIFFEVYCMLRVVWRLHLGLGIINLVCVPDILKP